MTNRWGGASRSPAQYAADIAAALMWGPKTCWGVLEIVAPTSRNIAGVRKYVEQYEASGCAYIAGFTANGKPIYAWNEKPFARVSVELVSEGNAAGSPSSAEAKGQ